MKKKKKDIPVDIILNPAKQLAEKYNKLINLCSLAIMLKLQDKGIKKVSAMDSLMVMQEIDLDYLDSLESKIKSNDKKVEQLDNDKKVEQLDNDKLQPVWSFKIQKKDIPEA